MTTNYHIYGNGGSGGPVDYSAPLATASAPPFSPPPVAAGSDWSFAVRAFDVASGLEESNTSAVRVLVDAAGRDATDRPPAPLHVFVAPQPGGFALVSWAMPPTTRANAPTGFHVYRGIGSIPDYTTALATVPVSGPSGRSAGRFAARMGGMADGVSYAVGVRAYNAHGEETNADVVPITAKVSAPAPVDGAAIV